MKIGNTYLSELLGDRFDVSFQLGNNASTSFIKHNPHRPLGEIAEFSSESWDQKSIFADIFPYIEIGNVDITTGEISAIEPISIKDAPSRAKKIVRKNDILVSTTRPNRGAICLYEQDEISIASTGFSIIRNIDNNIIRDFLFVMLRMPFSLEQMQLRSSGGNYPAIIESELKKILIPIPQKEVQEHIINIYSQAQQARLEKRQEAKQLLESIDDYLLEALKIEKKQQKKEKRSQALRNISSIIGGRLDVSFYSERFEMISTKYANEKLSSLVEIDPTVRFNNLKPEMPISFIPMECIDEIYGEIAEYREITVSTAKGYTKFEDNDLLWAKITPCMQNGKSAIVRNLTNGIGCGSTEYYVLRPKCNDILIEYIYLLLRHRELLKAAQSSFGGSAGQQRVSNQYFKSIIIPRPNISIQKEIVDTVSCMKDNAKQLQKEGDDLLAEAKQKIEKMIIG